MISAALITGIRSDLPGQITAQVTQHIYDSPTGSILLIPQGTRIIGEYDNGVTFGQRRVLLVWNRLIFPNGRSIVLERQPGADTAGYAGLEDGVDYHWWDLMKAAGLSTLLAVGAELTMDDEDRLIQAIRSGAQDTINDAGQQIIQRQLQVAPTLTIRPGFPVRVIVTRDLVLGTLWSRPMTKLKLGAIPDDKPVKVTGELAGGTAPGPRDLCRDSVPRDAPARRRSGQADRPDGGTLHGDRSRICKGAAEPSIARVYKRIALLSSSRKRASASLPPC